MNYEQVLQEEKNLVNTLIDKKILEKITLKKVKTEIGHDLCGYYCDFYLKGHGKIGYVNNDGWGGHVEPVYESDEKQKVFEKFLKDNNVGQIMFDNGWAFMDEVEKVLDEVGLKGQEGQLAYNVSHGDKKRLELAMALVLNPDLLLLDEPTAGMSPSETKETVELILATKDNHPEEIIHEATDILFHILMLLAQKGFKLRGIFDELEHRHQMKTQGPQK